eukprot:UN03820
MGVDSNISESFPPLPPETFLAIRNKNNIPSISISPINSFSSQICVDIASYLSPRQKLKSHIEQRESIIPDFSNTVQC